MDSSQKGVADSKRDENGWNVVSHFEEATKC